MNEDFLGVNNYQQLNNNYSFFRGQQLSTINQQFFKCGAKVQQKNEATKFWGSVR
jgi:hypothetical protein